MCRILVDCDDKIVSSNTLDVEKALLGEESGEESDSSEEEEEEEGAVEVSESCSPAPPGSGTVSVAQCWREIVFSAISQVREGREGGRGEGGRGEGGEGGREGGREGKENMCMEGERRGKKGQNSSYLLCSFSPSLSQGRGRERMRRQARHGKKMTTIDPFLKICG